jgi:hypothetical protein
LYVTVTGVDSKIIRPELLQCSNIHKDDFLGKQWLEKVAY